MWINLYLTEDNRLMIVDKFDYEGVYIDKIICYEMFSSNKAKVMLTVNKKSIVGFNDFDTEYKSIVTAYKEVLELRNKTRDAMSIIKESMLR